MLNMVFSIVFVMCSILFQVLPSGKRLHNYGKSPFLMGKSVNALFLWT